MASADEVQQSSLKRSASPLFEPQDTPSIASVGDTDALSKRSKVAHTPTDEHAAFEATSSDRTINAPRTSFTPYPTPELSTTSFVEQASVAELQNSDATSFPGITLVFNDRRPRLAWYYPYIKIVELKTTQVCRKFLVLFDNLKEAGYDRDVLDLACERITDFCDPSQKYPAQKPIVFAGSMGAGKSELINALLEEAGIALTGTTERGTNIVHEYVGLKKYQEARFVVDALYYPEAQIRQRIWKLCREAFTYFEITRRQEKEPEEVDMNDVHELRGLFNTAASTLFSILCDSEDDDFASEDAVSEWLECQYEDSTLDVNSTLDAVVEHLMNRIVVLMKTRGVEDDIESHNASSIAELTEIYDSVSRPPNTTYGPSKGHPWALIRKVQIHMDHDYLNQGGTIADTPGLTDSNQAIVDASKTYISSAGTLFIVTPFLRCNSNADLEEHLRLADRLGKMKCTRLVITKIDEGDTDRKSLPPAARDACEAQEKSIQQLKDKENALTADKVRFGANKQLDEYMAVDKELESLRRQIKSEGAKLYQIEKLGSIAAVEKDMSNKPRKVLGSKHAPDLPTHFTSATQYQKHRPAIVQSDPPQLDLAATGIPAIMEMLYRIPAEANFDALTNICLRTLPRTFENIVSILTKTPFERYQQVRALLRQSLEKRSQTFYESLESQVMIYYINHIAKCLEKHQNADWLARANTLVTQWCRLHGATFGAFCGRNGVWKTARNQGKISWNQQIQSIFADELGKGFEDLSDDVKTCKHSTMSNVTDWIFLPLQRVVMDNQVTNSKSFLKKIHDEKDDVLSDMSKYFDQLLRDFDKARGDSIMNDDDDSFVGAEMLPTYTRAAAIQAKDYPKVRKEKGKKRASGAHAERMRLIRTKVAENGPDNVFSGVSSAIETNCRDKAIKNFLALVEERLSKMVENVLQDYDERYQVSMVAADENGQRNEKFEDELREEAKVAIEYFNGEGRQMLEAAKKWEEENAQ